MTRADNTRLIVVSGRSGSGKSTVLHVLEDVGFTCIDNLPAGMLASLFEHLQHSNPNSPGKVAIGIDARNISGKLDQFPVILDQLKASGIDCEVLFLDASVNALIRRFSETRRRHPLSSESIDLKKAIALDLQILKPIAAIADRRIDTSNMTLHQLRDLIKKQIVPAASGGMAVLFQSFAFKHGVPVDADYVFDVRCLPNPYWKKELRQYNGGDEPVIEFLDTQTEVAAMLADLNGFLCRWIPRFASTNRSYLTIAVGCTGGQHRSVYVCNQLALQFDQQFPNIQVQHRELEN
ncbi:MAG: RNase adapter RapZ [Gammaproteobacteria bacterium]|nr:MAG: RNase adapter RapZ [Gammaproteobacteria bacterium]RLA53604.1 MAG: RNase adapter RapZ [Gammaproteobacteria bacterium]